MQQTSLQRSIWPIRCLVPEHINVSLLGSRRDDLSSATSLDNPYTEIEAMTNEEIVERCKIAEELPIFNPLNPGYSSVLKPPPIYILSPEVVMKTGHDLQSWEARTMELVRSSTNIPIPKVWRYFEHDEEHYLVMQYIPGVTLDRCWDTLSIWRKLWVAWKLRSYVRELRLVRNEQIDREVPGPITEDPSQPLKCHCPSTGESDIGPFHTKRELARWAHGRLRLTEQVWNVNCGVEPFDDSEHLVLTHGDIAWRNLILGDDGKLWLIDWGSSGVYPPWFEYAAMRRLYESRFWTYIRRFVAGAYKKQELFRLAIDWAIGEAWIQPTLPTPPASD
ncbi:kinase-like protein [Obba rivulosa]|uniref:Kinase-like protein n=1 Tax=Obba rivulosa TaxID=1052685 RepID=A0A8E2ALW5_9APHY|nr:kinase-like protein [Obba rivulosa]